MSLKDRTAEQFSQIPWQRVSEVASQKILDDGEYRLRLLKLSPGFQEAEWCTRGHVGYIIEGALHIEFEDSQVVYNAGDALLIRPGKPHKGRTGAGRALVFVVDEI